MHRYILLLLCFTQVAFANPYWDRYKVPRDVNYPNLHFKHVNVNSLKSAIETAEIPVLRIQTDWFEETESYSISHLLIEASGTPALLARSTLKPHWGSYLGILKSKKTGKELFYDSIGTGKEYRKLARAINLRFPVPKESVVFELYAENPQSGLMEKVLDEEINIGKLERETIEYPDLEVKELAIAKKSPSLRVNIYAEGYSKTEKNKFYKQAIKTVQALQSQQFPGVESMSFYAVFSTSNQRLGDAMDLGLPIPEYDSFLGLYYPYWDNFGRWYHIVYPTRENKFRQALATAPYDYPIVLVNNGKYWGVGNYKSHTAIPADNSTYFTYLLLHEIGHFFGLNEEYEGGGRTELEFAANMEEPWSQNITFLGAPSYNGLKWNKMVDAQTLIPTPYSDWESYPPVYGAYKGGYADSPSSKGYSHKPGLNCIMESNPEFCDICKNGILDVITHDLGIN
ncbi:M64 family metallopeptidase [Legionella waltersii]|uniref:IgA Peptidase M64 n=1 Tax=Legionella waltersii TaxID=66969 RepID=A0A0W1A1A6_9GAMM|nr:M64 family metallopeptidase [Legionella waltersii]KTD75153.1 IgA Peptidase M64 [Legionella waltersii]SNV04789.1 IgA Peptidase M64 [Legionella waltersii]